MQNYTLFPQISENKKKEFEQDDASAIENKEQLTKPDSRDVAVQNSPDCQEVAVQIRSDCQEVAVQIRPDFQVVTVQTHGEATAAEITGRPFALLLAEIPNSVPK